MADLKHIAATLAILGSGTLAVTGCNKEKAGTEVPGDDAGAADAGDDAGGDAGDAAGGDAAAGEAKCGGDAHTGEGHCGAEGETPPAEGGG
jgi:hypothetical protein